MSESEILGLLHEAHPAPAWAFLRHVANGTGGFKARTADAVAMSLWPSRGLELHGFEVKVYRGDWLRELKEPAKADEIATRCHHWWIVAPPEIVDIGELPATWGLLVVEGKGFRAAREAPLLTPAPLDWPFLAAILRRTADQMASADRLDARRERVGRETENARDPQKIRVRLDRLKSTIHRLHTDVSNALYDLDREERKAKREAGDEGEAA